MLTKVSSQIFLPEIAAILNNLGCLNTKQNEFTTSFDAFQKSLDIRRKLAKSDSKTFLPQIAETLNNLGLLYKSKNEFTAALVAYQEALEIFKTSLK